jgi:UDP-glucose 4-epimerase
MRILVTGGAGFIASHVTDRYIVDGHSVAVVDDLSTGKMQNLNPKAEFFKTDIRDGKSVADVFRKWQPEAVSHHAAHVNVRKAVDDPAYDATINVVGTLNLLQQAAACKCRKFVFISSGGAAYGEPERLPVDETHPVRPLSPYGASKYSGECYVQLFHRVHGLDYTILRYANIYGPRQDPHGEAGVVAIFSIAMLSGKGGTIFGDGTKTRDYVYVEDAVEANVKALTQPNSRGAFNIGTGVETSDRAVFDAIRDAVGAQVTPSFSAFRQGEVYRICLDASLAKRTLGWQPEVDFGEGIRRSVAFYRQAAAAR